MSVNVQRHGKENCADQKVHIVTAILVEMEESAQILAMVLNVTVSRDLQAEFVR